MHLGSTAILKIISSAGTKSKLCTGEFRGSVGELREKREKRIMQENNVFTVSICILKKVLFMVLSVGMELGRQLA